MSLERRDSARALACALSVLATLGFGVLAMLQAPRVPYADSWRFLAHFLTEPFPRNVLGMDNGHLELFPDLVRIAELHWLAADQGLQIAIGLLLAITSWAVALHWLRRQAAAATQLWAAALVLTLGLFWLGNFRALMHANETVHVYAVTLGLFSGLSLAWRGGLASAALAAGCAVFASLSFGSGLAVFPALLLVLAIRRAPWQEWMPTCVALVVVLLLMLSLSDGTAGSFRPAQSLAAIESLLRWLGGPPLYATWPVWDPQIAMRLPSESLRSMVEPVAAAYSERAGPVMLARWPHLAWGLLGSVGFAAALWQAFRRQRAIAVFGAGTAAFALSVGAMIVLVRAGYFLDHPEQLLAPRYLAWSSLFWAGLVLALIDSLPTARAAWAALLGFALLLPSQAWMHQLGLNQRDVAERTALAVAVGVIDPDMALGETVYAELAAAAPLLRKAGASVFRWREAQCLELDEAPAQLDSIETKELQIRAVGNRLGEPGRSVEFHAEHSEAQRLLLIDVDGLVRGLARRDRDGVWRGWMRGSGPLHGVRVAQPGSHCERPSTRDNAPPEGH